MGGGFEWPPPELFGGGFVGGGDGLVWVFVLVLCVFVVVVWVFVVLVGGGVVFVGGGVALGHVSLMLATWRGSFSVEGDTPRGRW